MADRSTATRAKPHTFSLVAAAEAFSGKGTNRARLQVENMLEWQVRAWDAYDNVGEFQFGISWLGNAMSRVNLIGAATPIAVGDEPSAITVPSDEELADPDSDVKDIPAVQRRCVELVEYIAGGPAGQGQLLNEFGIHLNVAGFGWLLAEPDLDDPDADEYETWGVYSQDAIKITGTGDTATVEVRIGGDGALQWRRVHPNFLLVKCWRKHPRRPWEPTAPVRASLAILDLLDLLTAHVTATAKSRLAGAGVLILPAEAEFPPPPPVEGEEPEESTPQDNFNRFVNEMIDHFVTPIQNRDSAAAVVPFPITVPGEFVDKVQHLAFSTPFDDRILDLLEAAIKRLSLGMDMPPEVLLGMAGVNHWTAWQVEDTAITLHVEPAAEICCLALTDGFLKAALEAEGFTPDEIRSVMVWYDTSDLSSAPDLSANAKEAWDRKEASGKALRHYLGLSEEDKPDDEEFKQRTLLDVAKGAPTLAPIMLAKAGLIEEDVAQVVEEVEGTPAGPTQSPPQPPEATPAPRGTPPVEDRPSASVRHATPDAVIMACDGIAYRAMERAGTRLKNNMGRKLAGGPQSIAHTDVATLHTVHDATLYADLDQLLDGAFTRIPDIAATLGLDADALHATMNAYCRALLAAGHEHDRLRLTSALGIDATV